MIGYVIGGTISTATAGYCVYQIHSGISEGPLMYILTAVNVFFAILNIKGINKKLS